MPIQFPPGPRDPPWGAPENLFSLVPTAWDITNLANIGAEFDGTALDPGIGKGWPLNIATNLRSIGNDFEAQEWTARVNPVPRPAVDAAFSIQQTGFASFVLSGVSRDSTGAILGNCVIDLFLTATDVLQQSTTSDASGAFWFSLMAPGPYYIVAYKSGSPDVAGTTVNTLQPA